MLRASLTVAAACALGLAACRSTPRTVSPETRVRLPVAAPIGDRACSPGAPDAAPRGASALLVAVPGAAWSVDTGAPEERADVAQPGAAGEPGDSLSRPGIYLGFSYGRAFPDFGSSDPYDFDFHWEPPPSEWDADYYDPDDASAIAIRCGARFSEVLAGELEYATVDGFDDSATVRGGKATFELELWTLTASVKGYFGTGRFQPYIVGGAGVIDGEQTISVPVGGRTVTVSEDETSAVFKLGGGVDAYLTDSWALSAEFAFYWPTGDLSEFDYGLLSIGVLYRF